MGDKSGIPSSLEEDEDDDDEIDPKPQVKIEIERERENYDLLFLCFLVSHEGVIYHNLQSR